MALRIVYFGTPGFAVPSLEALLASDVQLTGDGGGKVPLVTETKFAP